MFDAKMRRLIDPPLNKVAARLAAAGLTGNMMTSLGLLLGLGSALAVANAAFELALALLLISRIADGLDGAVARAREEASEFGGYYDIVSDFLVWAALPVGFAIADVEANALPAAILLASFIGTTSSFLAYAILAAKAGHENEAQGKKSFYYLSGLTEGTETIAFFTAMMLLPDWFPILAYIFAAMALVTTISRVLAARKVYG